MSIKQGSVVKSLTDKGFRKDPKKRRKHTKYKHYGLDGKKTGIFTEVSHKPDSYVIPRNIIGEMSRQLGLSGPEFKLLVQCNLTKEMYAQKVTTGGLRPIQ